MPNAEFKVKGGSTPQGVRNNGGRFGVSRENAMLIKKAGQIPSSEITDEKFYRDRRRLMQLMGGAAVALGAAPLLQACSSDPESADFAAAGGPSVVPAQTPLASYKPKVVSTDEKLNSFEEITGYNNFYEFGQSKSDPQRNAGRLT